MKKTKGITLIALVITIIILLILASIAINLTLGDNGIFRKAKESKMKYEIAQYIDRIDGARGAVAIDNEGVVTLDNLIEQIYVENIVPRGNITKLNEDQARMVTKEEYVFIITADTTTYVSENEKEAKYIVECWDEKGNEIKREEKTAKVGIKINATEEDKRVPGYTFDETNINNIVSTTVNEEGSAIIKLYFIENPGVYVVLNGDTLNFYSNETTAKANATGGAIYYENVHRNIIERTGDEVVGTLENIPWKEYLDSIKTVNIVEEIAPTNMDYYFADLKNCGAINGIQKIKTDNVESMKGLFQWCGVNNDALKTIDISTFNTSKVTNMANMFDRCRKVQQIKLPTNFDTSKVTSMRNMFNNIRNVTNLDLSSLDTRNVTDMYGMFYYASALTEINLPNTFDTSKVTTMESMFADCKSLISLDLSNFNVSNVTTMKTMFSNCQNLTELDLANFDASNVTNVEAMFYYCIGLVKLNLSNFNSIKVTSMNNMFNGLINLKELNLDGFKTDSVKDMNSMFKYCETLETLDVSKFNTSKVEDMSFMFENCKLLLALDVSNFNTSNVKSMKYMFTECKKITTLDVLNFDTKNVTDMSYMFASCDNLETLDLSSFDTNEVTDMTQMFASNVSLATIYIGDNWKLAPITTDILTYCKTQELTKK